MSKKASLSSMLNPRGLHSALGRACGLRMVSKEAGCLTREGSLELSVQGYGGV